MLTPGQIKAIVIGLLVVAFGAAGFFAIRSYNNALTENATMKKDLDDAIAVNIQANERINELEANRKADAAAIEAKENERKAYAELLASTVKDYRHDIKQLQEADRACAGRTVPAPVDRMLSQSRN